MKEKASTRILTLSLIVVKWSIVVKWFVVKWFVVKWFVVKWFLTSVNDRAKI
jgi:hypothetical protein